LARMAALSGIRTCVVGLDMQADISSALSDADAPDESESLDAALARMAEIRGLIDVFNGDAAVKDVILPTAIPTLSFIPETAELVALDQGLVNKNRREYWLREKVVEVLKDDFDLVIMDCCPNWNRLITNGLAAADLLLSPVECKINNFRNLKIFRGLVEEFKQDLQLGFSHYYVPTRLTPQRRLSMDIYNWYRAHLGHCLKSAIRDSVQGEEAMALRISVPEHAPTSDSAFEMRTMMEEIWEALGIPQKVPDRGMSLPQRSMQQQKQQQQLNSLHGELMDL
jgi:chromosome partitioning protein